MGAKKNITVASTTDTVKIVAEPTPFSQTSEGQVETKQSTKTKIARIRSKKYVASRANIDKTKLYDAFAAIELVKRLSYSKFDGSIEAHGVVKEAGETFKVKFPKTAGKAQKVAVLDDKVLAEIEAGTINFDVLLASPDQMKQITKFAKILGPKGLMPNPKNGTLVADPEKAAKKFGSGATAIKTEKKAPLIHLTIGKVSMDTKDLVANLQALTTTLKGKLVKLTICASMSPSVKVEVE